MIRTKRLADPTEPEDGTRILVTRYRPRGVRRGAETWDEWEKRVAPSVKLLGFGLGWRAGPRVSWDEYAQRYLAEMLQPEARAAIGDLARRSRAGETLTLLCYCQDGTRCHRTLLRRLVKGSA